jgi:hypothetical protein
MKKDATPKHKGLQSNTTDEKEATPKCKGLKSKTSNEKEVTPKCKGLESKTSNEKRGNLNAQVDRRSGTISSPKPSLPN